MGGFGAAGVGFAAGVSGFLASSTLPSLLSLGAVAVLVLRVRAAMTGGASGRWDLIQLRKSSSFSEADFPTVDV